jgi:hypothetical protein
MTHLHALRGLLAATALLCSLATQAQPIALVSSEKTMRLPSSTSPR